MQLLSPDIGLIGWMFLALASLILSILAIVKLSAYNINPYTKLLWVICIILFPFIGALTFIAMYRKEHSNV